MCRSYNVVKINSPVFIIFQGRNIYGKARTQDLLVEILTSTSKHKPLIIRQKCHHRKNFSSQ